LSFRKMFLLVIPKGISFCHSEAEGEESPSYGWSSGRVSLLHLEENPCLLEGVKSPPSNFPKRRRFLI
jgi:hypothetical protein